MSHDERIELDHYLLFDPHTQRITLTRTGRKALAARFARVGVDINQIRTLKALEDAISTVTHREYKCLTPAQQDDDAYTDPIEDLYFITDRIQGRPALPLPERRQRERELEQKFLSALGITF